MPSSSSGSTRCSGAAGRILLLLSATCLLALSSCVSPEEIRRRDEAACAGYGFKPGTADFAACLQRESLWRRYQLDRPFWGPSRGWW